MLLWLRPVLKKMGWLLLFSILVTQNVEAKPKPNLENSLENSIDSNFVSPEEALSVVRQRPQLKTPIQREQTQKFTTFSSDAPMSQVTSISELQDVSPTDWAYEALRSLVERYGCLVGYPDRTYRGEKALTRWEFAAGLNACLNTIERLLQENVAVLREDIEKLKRLAQEFEQELMALDARIHNLEQRTAYLEDHYFSTTTKLTGQVFAYVSNAWRGDNLLAEGASVMNPFNPPRDELNRPRTRRVNANPNTTLSYYNFLRFNSSFQGNDNLILQLAVGNGNAPANEMLSAGFFNSSGAPFALQSGTPTQNSVVVHELFYEFPAFENVQLVVGPRIQVYNFFDTNRFTFFITGSDSFNSSGSTQFSAIDRGSGAIAVWDINQTFQLHLGYVGNNTEFLPGEIGSSASDPDVMRGLFGGTYNLMAELDIAATDTLNLRFLYTRNRLEPNPFNGFVGGAVGEPIPYGYADDGFGGKLHHAFGDVFVFNFDWLVTEGFGLFGRYSYGSTDLTPENPDRPKGSIDSQSLQLGFALPDFLKEGAQANFSYLIPFSITNGREFLLSGGGDGAVQSEFELSYYYPLNDNIAVVPSFYMIIRPNNFSQNAPLYVGNVRTQFNF